MPVKVYDGTNWVTVAGDGQQGPAATSSSIATWVKTASGGETSVSGTGDTGYGTLAYTVGQELVYLNGVLLDRGDDYTATNGTSITGLTALTANDVVTVWTVNSFSVANTYTIAQADAAFAPIGQGITLLSTTPLSGASVTVSGINQTYTSLIISITGMSSSSDYAPKFQYNGVTSGYFGIGSSDGATANTRISGGSYLDAAWLDIWEGSNANSIITYSIPNYTASGYHTVSYQGAYLTNTAVMRQFTASGGNTNTSAVTSITLSPDAGSFNAGSIKIYGVK